MNRVSAEEQESTKPVKDPAMLLIAIFIVVYLLLQLVILPKLGIPT